jgi:outer membrane immunogenic protein
MRRVVLAGGAAVITLTFSIILGAVSAEAKPSHPPTFETSKTTPYSWTGWYVGVNLGGGWSSRDVTFNANDPAAASIFGTGLPATSFNTLGVIGGLQFGYNWEFQPKYLVGFETDFDGSGIAGSGSSYNSTYFGKPTGLVNENINWFGTVRARLGWIPVNNLLTFVTGGFAYGQVKHTGSYAFAPGQGAVRTLGGYSVGCGTGGLGSGLSCFVGSSTDIAVGWALGGGLEYALSQQWHIKAEYLYVSLESKSLKETATFLQNPADLPGSINANFNRTDFNIARVGLNYFF